MGENEAHDVIVTRKFDAPRERIWRAWSDPDEVMKWWGPQGFTSPMCRMGSARETPRSCACVRTRAGSCITRGRTCRSSRWSGSSSTKDSRTKTVTKSPCRARPPPRDPGGGVIVFSSTISYSSSSTCSPNWLYELNVPSAQNLCECSIGPAASAHGCLGSLAGTFSGVVRSTAPPTDWAANSCNPCFASARTKSWQVFARSHSPTIGSRSGVALPETFDA
jgi:hypothetical protein